MLEQWKDMYEYYDSKRQCTNVGYVHLFLFMFNSAMCVESTIKLSPSVTKMPQNMSCGLLHYATNKLVNVMLEDICAGISCDGIHVPTIKMNGLCSDIGLDLAG